MNNNRRGTKILIVGRPGIGKSVLGMKILYNSITLGDDFYNEKVVILLKFRNFNSEKRKGTTLREMLLTGLPGGQKFESIYQYVTEHPEKTVIIFDGLDELKIDHEIDISEIEDPSIDNNEKMSVFYLFAKIIYGQFLPGATVVTTVRSTAWDGRFTSLHEKFDKTLEILGFCKPEIERYIKQYFDLDDDNDSEEKSGDDDDKVKRKNKAKMVRDYVFESAELTSLCYVPVSSLILCFALDKLFDDGDNNGRQGSVDKERLPKTLTQLYEMAIRVILWHHHPLYKNVEKEKGYLYSDDKLPSEIRNTLAGLKEIAYLAMTEGSLLFNIDEDLYSGSSESSDRVVTQASSKDNLGFKIVKSQFKNITNSGLLLSFEDDCDLLCSFIHLSIQEFLAAGYLVGETRRYLTNFLSKRIDEVNWHLVIQFLFGLLGSKFKNSLEELKKSSQGYVHIFLSGLSIYYLENKSN